MKKKEGPRTHIGEEYGIYKIIGVEDERNKDGYILYKAKCKECGYERCAKLSSFKQNNAQTCIHKNLLSDKQIEQWYEKNKVHCLYCGEYIPLGNLGFNEYKKCKFCNSSCASSYNNEISENKYKKIKKAKPIKLCKNCGKEIKHTNQFCSISCYNEYSYKENVKKWKNGELSRTVKDGAADFVKKYIK